MGIRLMTWNLDPNLPIYLQIIEHLQYDIASGQYRPGERLPSVRELALCAAVNPNTMQKALSALEQSGLVLSRRTLGRFVTEDPAVISEARTALATHQITELIQKMQQLGFQKREILTLIEKIYEEVTHEHTSGNP